MDIPLIAARAVHFAAQISLAGIFIFIVLVAVPAYARVDAILPSGLRHRLAIGAWASLALTLLSAIPWLVLVAHGMSARPFPDLLAQGTVATVLLHTRFGHAWILRMSLVVLLIPFVAAIGKRRGFDAAAALLGAALLAATAWEGHAGAEEGLPGIVHLGADAAHLVAAGGWVGTLVPLALLLTETRRAGDRRSAMVAQAATLAFSDLGLSCVAALLVTGAFNAWFLVGTPAALIGTVYGKILLVKLALFAAMTALAAVNRLHLLPLLATSDHGRKALASRNATTLIKRNALIEAGIGLGALAVVAVLGTQVPAEHEQPWWPFAYRFGLDAIAADPTLRNDAIGTASIALVGLALVGFGWRRRQALAIITGLVLFLGLGWRPIQLLIIDATPTSYYRSPESFDVRSIAAGGSIYAQHCVACHGPGGQGDGSLATELPLAPADLTAHLFAHTDGDLFWFIGKGMEGGAMPPFAATLGETQRWDVVNFIKMLAASAETSTLSAAVAADPAPLAPDFAFPAAEGAPGTLAALLVEDAVLLVLDDAPRSPLAAQAEAWRSVLAASGVAVLVLSDEPALWSVYAHYDRRNAADAPPSTSPIELLIDRDGYIRALWHPGDAPDWRNREALTREIANMSRLKLAPAAQRVHAHPMN